MNTFIKAWRNSRKNNKKEYYTRERYELTRERGDNALEWIETTLATESEKKDSNRSASGAHLKKASDLTIGGSKVAKKKVKGRE